MLASSHTNGASERAASSPGSDPPLEPAIASSLDQVASRLNGLGATRAGLRLASLLLALLAAAFLAGRGLPGGSARMAWLALSAVGALGAFLVHRSFRSARVGPSAAGRFVESCRPLDQRLLTLVTAGSANSRDPGSSLLWRELVADNVAHLDRWRPDSLAIPRVPRAELLAFLLVLSITGPLLWSLWPAAPALDEPARTAAGSSPAEDQEALRPEDPDALAQKALASAAGAAGGEPGGPGASAAGGVAAATAAAGAATTLGAGGVGGTRQGQDMGEGGVPLGAAGPGPAGLGGRNIDGMPVAANQTKSRSEAGGRLPAPGLEQRDLGEDGRPASAVGGSSNQAGGPVTVREGRSGGSKAGAPAGSGTVPPGAGPIDGGKPAAADPRGGKGNTAPSGEPPGASTAASGGGKAGSGRGTEALLAPRPLTLAGAGARASARFDLALGATAGDGARRDGKGTMQSEPVGHVASGARGPQEAERGIRHEAVPAEYEPIIKRIFTREP